MLDDSLLNNDYIKRKITNNETEPVSYRWTHGATDLHLGDGIIVYSLIQYMRFKNCICIGSGGGYIPRIMTQARVDLYNQGIFEGEFDYNWGDIGTTYLVDACNGVCGNVDWEDEDSFFRFIFRPRFIKATSKDAYYDFFIRQDIKADIIFIDADHSYDAVKLDFELYSTLLTDNGIILIHDVDEEYEKSLIVSEDAKKDNDSFEGPIKFINELKKDSKWNLVLLKNFHTFANKPTSSGLALINKNL